MNAKFDSECDECTINIRKGDRIVYDFDERTVACSRCGERVFRPDPKQTES